PARRNADLLPLAVEQSPVLLDLVGAARQPAACQHLVGHFQEGLGEEALAPVDVDDALVEDEVRGRSRQRALRDALRQGFALEVGEPAVEVGGILAVRLGQGRRACQQHGHYGQSKSSHDQGPLLVVPLFAEGGRCPMQPVEDKMPGAAWAACWSRAISPILTVVCWIDPQGSPVSGRDYGFSTT